MDDNTLVPNISSAKRSCGLLSSCGAVSRPVFAADFSFNLVRNSMRVLLRDSATGLYFQEPENWTAESEKAQSFRHSAEAMNLARLKQVRHAEVVLAFEEPGYTVALPLP